MPAALANPQFHLLKMGTLWRTGSYSVPGKAHLTFCRVWNETGFAIQLEIKQQIRTVCCSKKFIFLHRLYKGAELGKKRVFDFIVFHFISLIVLLVFWFEKTTE